MLVALLLVFIILFISLFTFLQIVGVLSLHCLHGLLGYLFELLKLFIHVLLNLIPLSEEHLIFLDVVDGLVVVGYEVAFNERTVAHEKFFSSAICVFTDVIVGKTSVFILLTTDNGLLHEGCVPVTKRC